MTERKDSIKRLNKKMKAFLKAYEAAMGNISASCANIGVGRTIFYKWKADNEMFREAVEAIDEKNVDFAETMLLKNIREGKETSLIFYLKTKGKNRGYVETNEVNANINGIQLRHLTNEELDELKRINQDNE